MFAKTVRPLILVVFAVLILSACQAAPAAQAPAAPQATAVPQAPAAPQATQPPKLPEEIIVGMVEPLTGSFAVYGQESQVGAQLAIQDINDAGGVKSMGGKKLKLVIEDAGGTPDTAKLGTESMISKNHPIAILGLYVSRFVMTASEVTDREHVILLADALVPQVTQMGRQYLFRPGPQSPDHCAMAYHFVRDLAKANNVEVKSMAVLNEDSVGSRACTLGATQAALEDKFPVVTVQEYPYDITDATALVDKIHKSGADFIVQSPYFNDAIVFGKAFKESGLWPMFIAAGNGSGYVDPESIKALGDAAEGISNTYSYNPAKNTAQNKKFVAAFQKIKGYIPTEPAGMNYYDAMTLYEALEYSGKNFPDDPLNPDNLRKAFLALDLTTGPAADTYPSGHIKFDATGQNQFPGVIVMQVQNGQPKVVYPADAAEAKPIWPNPHYKPQQ